MGTFKDKSVHEGHLFQVVWVIFFIIWRNLFSDNMTFVFFVLVSIMFLIIAMIITNKNERIRKLKRMVKQKNGE